MIMVGPAIVEGLDDEIPAALSPKIIGKLKNDLNFKGIVMSDDLDAKATLRGRTVEVAAVEALNAGADFLLLAAFGNQLENVVKAISQAVESGHLAEERLFDAGQKVRQLAMKYSN